MGATRMGRGVSGGHGHSGIRGHLEPAEQRSLQVGTLLVPDVATDNGVNVGQRVQTAHGEQAVALWFRGRSETSLPSVMKPDHEMRAAVRGRPKPGSQDGPRLQQAVDKGLSSLRWDDGN